MGSVELETLCVLRRRKKPNRRDFRSKKIKTWELDTSIIGAMDVC